MIEKIITSKTRVKILKLFLTHIDDRYYLRELERLLNESLSPLRRQLIKLEKMGILMTEEEANLKYYRLNRNFAGIEEFRRLVLGTTETPLSTSSTSEVAKVVVPRRVRNDIAVLTVISVLVLATAAFIVYSNVKNMKQVADLVSGKPAITTSKKRAEATSPDEMISRRWKVKAGSFPVLSSGEPGEAKNQEL